MFAIIETGGKQYKISEGDVLFIEKLYVNNTDIANEGDTVTFDKVLALQTDTFKAGNPTVAGASVTAKVIKNGKNKKLYILRYKSKKNEKKKIGHRQPYTKVQIEKIVG
jgi:large subunit ribosomal protein L21